MPGLIEAPEANTVEIVPVVFVSVEADHKTSSRFTTWLLENRICGLRGYGYGDPYRHSGFYKAEDAERIRAWCADNGVTVEGE
jgi:hypothetical protein